MDTQQSTPTFDQNNAFDESIARVMQTLPPTIRAYLLQGKYTTVAKDLMSKYGLRIDQGGVLEREIMLLLMGVENPTEFTHALTESARLTPQIVSGIVQDVNAQIFVPLREQMKSGAGNIPQPEKPVAPQTASVGVPSYTPRPPAPRQPMGIMKPPPQSPMYSTLGKEPPPSGFLQRPPVVPQPVQQPVMQPPPIVARSPASTIAPLPPKAALPRPAEAFGVVGPSQAFPVGAQPAISAPAPSVPTPLQQALRTVMPRPAGAFGAGGPPANLPGAMPQSDIIPPRPPAPTTPRTAGTDPYREQINER